MVKLFQQLQIKGIRHVDDNNYDYDLCKNTQAHLHAKRSSEITSLINVISQKQNGRKEKEFQLQ